mmetsp:Transcript_36911/g.78292  ORF Transcript_36911/g.78292 Transcript_36911/m.78292 type:complete len:123 (+) Transcript_36911:66-434(+)
MSRVPALALAFAAAVLARPTTAVVWIQGGAGSSCETVCQARGGCLEDAWPSTEAEFAQITEDLGFTCHGTQEGGAKYDPSTDGRYCGWSGPHPENGGAEPRCPEEGDASTYRFCPCVTEKEL